MQNAVYSGAGTLEVPCGLQTLESNRRGSPLHLQNRIKVSWLHFDFRSSGIGSSHRARNIFVRRRAADLQMICTIRGERSPITEPKRPESLAEVETQN